MDRIRDILPDVKACGVTAKDNRLFVERDLRYRPASLADLPERFGDPIKYIRASHAGPRRVWKKLFEMLRAMRIMSSHDRQHDRAGASASAGAQKKTRRPGDRRSKAG